MLQCSPGLGFTYPLYVLYIIVQVFRLFRSQTHNCTCYFASVDCKDPQKITTINSLPSAPRGREYCMGVWVRSPDLHPRRPGEHYLSPEPPLGRADSETTTWTNKPFPCHNLHCSPGPKWTNTKAIQAAGVSAIIF